MHEIQFHPDADKELDEAVMFYRSRGNELPHRLLDDVVAGLERIKSCPERYPKTAKGRRRFLLKHFPYSVIYEFDEFRVLVLAIAHHRRSPGYWHTRKSN